VVTDAECRGTGAGRALMQEGVARCVEAWPGRGIRISAQAHLQRFYGSLGFESVGNEYLEDNIPHIEMWRRP
jgi:ElaA protein